MSPIALRVLLLDEALDRGEISEADHAFSMRNVNWVLEHPEDYPALVPWYQEPGMEIQDE